jgi:hypothetical protein
MIHLKYANSRMTWEYAEYVEKAGVMAWVATPYAALYTAEPAGSAGGASLKDVREYQAV